MAQRKGRRYVLDNLIVGKWKMAREPDHHPYWNEWVFPTMEAAKRYTDAVEELLVEPDNFQYYFGLYFLVVKDDAGRPIHRSRFSGPSGRRYRMIFDWVLVLTFMSQ